MAASSYCASALVSGARLVVASALARFHIALGATHCSTERNNRRTGQQRNEATDDLG